MLRVLGIIFLIIIVIIVGLGIWGYRMAKQMQNSEEFKAPKVLETAGVVRGEEQLQKSVFYESSRLGTVSEIRHGNYDLEPGEEWVIVGQSGADFLDDSRKQKKTVHYQDFPFGRVQMSDLNGDGAPEFVCSGIGRKLIVFSSEGKELWSHSSFWGINNAAVGDVNGDGRKEVAVGLNGFAGVHLLNAQGGTLWEVKDGNVWHVEIVDREGDGKGEILHSNASGELVVRDAAGEVVSRKRLGNYFSRFALTRWGDEPTPRHLLTVDDGTIRVTDLDGEKAAQFEAPPAGRFADAAATPWRARGGSSVFVTLVHHLMWRRTVLYVHVASGALLYQEVFEEDCGAVTSLPGETGESLLVGCENKVWKYSPTKAFGKNKPTATKKKAPK